MGITRHYARNRNNWRVWKSRPRVTRKGEAKGGQKDMKFVKFKDHQLLDHLQI